MKQNVNLRDRRQRQAMRRRIARARIALGAVALGTGANLVFLWLGIPFRIYASASFWYYVNLLSGNRWIGSLLGVATCLGYGFWIRDVALGRKLYAADTAFLLMVCLFLLENPLCCLPELVIHGAVLGLLWPSTGKFPLRG